MRFRLTYSGPLRSRRREPQAHQPDRLATHIQEIRRQFHPQLRELWAQHRFLSTHKIWKNDEDQNGLAIDAFGRWAPDENEMVPLASFVSERHSQFGFSYVPLVRTNWELSCELDILFLRSGGPGSVVHDGDIDNRIKTLIDGMRMPQNENEVAGIQPENTDTPFFVLLEDDRSVTSFRVDSDRLLAPVSQSGDVQLVVTVTIKPVTVTTLNINFA